jgi:hypothetical protein
MPATLAITTCGLALRTRSSCALKSRVPCGMSSSPTSSAPTFFMMSRVPAVTFLPHT